MSMFAGSAAGSSPGTALNGLRFRDAHPDERRHAFRLALRAASTGSAPPEQQVDSFLQYLRLQGLEVTWTLVILEDDHLAGACLGIASPGRTVMVMPSPCPGGGPLSQGLSAALRELERRARAQNATLLQALTDQRTAGHAQALQDAGYTFLADLRYMTVGLQTFSRRRSERTLTLRPYETAGHALFCETLGRTYAGSLDCPALFGCRDVEDVVATHKATGIHDPGLWLLAFICGRPVGVLLLTRTPLCHAMEIVYVGVVPEARGRGYGRQLVEAALECMQTVRCSHLLLAVDSHNRYALQAYRSVGFSETDQRFAWFLPLVQRVPPPGETT